MDKRQALLKKIMMADFSMHEAALFLDTHPHNKAALSFYRKMQAKREELAEQFRKEYGPLTYYEVKSSGWNWIDTPWPWQN